MKTEKIVFNYTINMRKIPNLYVSISSGILRQRFDYLKIWIHIYKEVDGKGVFEKSILLGYITYDTLKDAPKKYLELYDRTVSRIDIHKVLKDIPD